MNAEIFIDIFNALVKFAATTVDAIDESRKHNSWKGTVERWWLYEGISTLSRTQYIIQLIIKIQQERKSIYSNVNNN